MITLVLICNHTYAGHVTGEPEAVAAFRRGAEAFARGSRYEESYQIVAWPEERDEVPTDDHAHIESALAARAVKR